MTVCRGASLPRVPEHNPFLADDVRRVSSEPRRSLVERERDALRQTLQHAYGRLSLRAVLRFCELDNDSFSTNTSQNACLQGKQMVGRTLMRALKAISLEHAQLMEREEAEEMNEGT